MWSLLRGASMNVTALSGSQTHCLQRHRQPFVVPFAVRWLSASKSTSTPLKKLIKPFLVKYHPDMAAQQGLPNTAVQVNLKAIQNLNSYIDAALVLEQSGKHSFPSDVVEIEFVMAFSTSGSSVGAGASAAAAAAQPTTSRRRVELQVPPLHMPLTKVSSHVSRQVVQLLRMADLSVPKVLDLHSLEEEEEESPSGPTSAMGLDEEWIMGQVLQEQQERGKTAWDRSRDRFFRRLNWNKFDEVYEKALKDAQANLETRGLVRDNPRLRRQLLAKILSHVVFTEAVEPLERLVAYRRLLRLLDEHFDYLELESFGGYWEALQILVTESRPYNTSSTAMRKRRQRHLETGYRFTIHHDNTVTVQIPVDFRNDELIQELRRNVRDFYEWTQQDYFGLEGLLEDDDVV